MLVAFRHRETELKGQLYALRLRQKEAAARRTSATPEEDLRLLLDTGGANLSKLVEAIDLPARLWLYQQEGVRADDVDTAITALSEVACKSYLGALNALDWYAGARQGRPDSWGNLEEHLHALACSCVISEAWRMFHMYDFIDSRLEYGDRSPFTLEKWLSFAVEEEQNGDTKVDPRVLAMVITTDLVEPTEPPEITDFGFRPETPQDATEVASCT